MPTQKLAIGTLIAFIFIFLLDYLWYGVLMSDFFTRIPGADRAQPEFLWLILGTLSMAYAFCYIYYKGREKEKPVVAQGVRYGFVVCLLLFVPMAFIRYGVQQHAPLSEYLIDLVYRFIQIIVLGIIIAKVIGLQGARPGHHGDGGD